MRYLVGIDDTDNYESIGTGAMARELVGFLARDHRTEGRGITRHQLLVHPDIPYTSHNSSACLALECPLDREELAAACRAFIAFLFHPGADPGLCVATLAQASAPDIVDFARRAQHQIVTREEATSLARAGSLLLEELGGTGLGVIGALAACGLRASGDDGRFIALPGARRIQGEITVGELRRAVAIDRVVDANGEVLADESIIETRGWVRPDLRDGHVTLSVQGEHGRYTVLRPGRGDDDR